MRLAHVLLACLPVAAALGQERPWSVDPKPALVLGDANADVLFGAGLIGATRLANGNVIVGDRADFSLKLFSPAGKLLKQAARKGSGPGEMTYIRDLWRCGNKVVVADIENGHRITVFSTDLATERSFMFRGPLDGGSSPYRSSCNGAGTFVHFGWPSRNEMKGGAHRPRVPVWTTGTDTTMRALGEMLGSERWGQVIDGQLRGSRPMPLGKQPVIAMGSDRFYTGEAETYTIVMRDLTGRVLGSFGKPGAPAAVTPADVDLSVERDAAGDGDDARARVRKSYAAIELPKTLPAYRELLVDSEGAVWVQDFPRGINGSATWTVFTRDGKLLAEVQLPVALTVFEIGRDYVLGKYVDPAEDIPEVRLYRLRRER